MRIVLACLVALCIAGTASAQQQPPADQPPPAADQAPPPAAPPPPPAPEVQPPAVPPASPPLGKPPTTLRPPPVTQHGPPPPPSARGANVICRVQGSRKGLRGEDLLDYMQVCVLETRLRCLKQAIARRIVGPARRNYIAACER